MTETSMRFSLATLASHELAELGMRIRRCSELESKPRTCGEIARAIVDLVWDAFQAPGMPQLALVRMYQTRPVGTLPPELRRAFAHLADEARCLALVATRGLEPAWNVVDESKEHRALPFDDPEAVARAPMVAKLLADLALGRGSGPPDDGDVFFIDDAIGSEHVPAQVRFVLRYGVRSVVGCGGVIASETAFALVVFARVKIAPDVASAFATLGLQASIALGTAVDLDISPAQLIAQRTNAYERLMRLQEYLFIRLATTSARQREQDAARLLDLERSLATEASTSASRHERTQRAMLNVIEDLRDARASLEQRVAERTLELERSNLELRNTNAELEQFAYIASHDLQEPLRTIAGYLQLIDERYRDRLDEEGHQFIDYAVRGAHRLQELIEALLAYSRVSRAPIEVGTVALDQVVDDVLQAMARSIEDTRASISREPLPVVRGDAVLLRQLFQNLIANAIKFAGASPPRVEILATRPDGHTEVTVRDHGVGFDPKYAEQIFKVFRRLQRKLPGTGIGLAICKKIVERHEGTIRATATPGHGATFFITFPTLEVS